MFAEFLTALFCFLGRVRCVAELLTAFGELLGEGEKVLGLGELVFGGEQLYGNIGVFCEGVFDVVAFGAYFF